MKEAVELVLHKEKFAYMVGNDPVNCKAGHKMKLMRPNQAPPGYRDDWNINCDEGSINDKSTGNKIIFYHCPICESDLCLKCVI